MVAACRRGVCCGRGSCWRQPFRNVEHLIAAIQEFIEHHNTAAQPYVWTNKADEILAKVARARDTLNKTPSI